MGYPLTFRRFINRNHISDGDYENSPVDWFAPGGAVAWELLNDASKEKVLEIFKTVVDTYTSSAESYNQRVRMMMGDLRRLEKDTADERAICQTIARSTNIEVDDVAAVLLAYLSL